MCVEVDIRRPFRFGYWLRGQRWRVQYEGLQRFCFQGGKYGHGEAACPSKATEQWSIEDQSTATSTHPVHLGGNQPVNQRTTSQSN